MSRINSNYFDRLFHRIVLAGEPEAGARRAVFEAYLDGKPSEQRKRTLSRGDRDRLFWSSGVVAGCTPDEWGDGAMLLAITRYLGQGEVSAAGLIEMLARGPGWRHAQARDIATGFRGGR